MAPYCSFYRTQVSWNPRKEVIYTPDVQSGLCTYLLLTMCALRLLAEQLQWRFQLKMGVNYVFSNHMDGITTDKLCWAILFFCLFHTLKPTSFSVVLKNAASLFFSLLWCSRNPSFPSTWGRVDNDRIYLFFFFFWVNCSFKISALHGYNQK